MLYCNKPLRATPTIEGGNLILTLPSIGSLSNGDVLKFVICQSIDYSNPLGTVSLRFGTSTTDYPLLTKFSNDARIDQMRSRTVYAVGFGSQAEVFTVLTPLPCTAFPYPVVDVSATPTPVQANTVAEQSAAPLSAKTSKTKKEAVSNE